MKNVYEVTIKGTQVIGAETPPDGRYALINREDLDMMLDGCKILLRTIDEVVGVPMSDNVKRQIPEGLEIDGEKYWREGVFHISKEYGIVQIRFITVDRAHREGLI